MATGTATQPTRSAIVYRRNLAVGINLFDRLQLDEAIATSRSCKLHWAEAGRKRYLQRREARRRKVVNDSDRLKKYLARFNLIEAALR